MSGHRPYLTGVRITCTGKWVNFRENISFFIGINKTVHNIRVSALSGCLQSGVPYALFSYKSSEPVSWLRLVGIKPKESP